MMTVIRDRFAFASYVYSKSQVNLDWPVYAYVVCATCVEM
jgi:thymidylate kinase